MSASGCTGCINRAGRLECRLPRNPVFRKRELFGQAADLSFSNRSGPGCQLYCASRGLEGVESQGFQGLRVVKNREIDGEMPFAVKTADNESI